jgi:hypothetical protein
VVVVDCLCRSNVEGAERICAVTLFEDVSDDYSIDDANEFDENYEEPRESHSECAERGASDVYKCTEVDATENCFHWKRQEVR